MKFIIIQEHLLRLLQNVQGTIERRQTLPILSNILLSCQPGMLSITATDTEVQITAKTALETGEEGEITVPARKLLDICRTLPTQSKIHFSLEGAFAILRAGRGRFSLGTLPARDYPTMDPLQGVSNFTVEEYALRQCIEQTHFAMAHQDIRYYLNGLLLEVIKGKLRAVATDGHRLAMADLETDTGLEEERLQVILPRKGASELLRILGNGEQPVQLSIGGNAIQFTLPSLQFTSKLIEGRFPDYENVIPDPNQCDKKLQLDKETLRRTLARVSILSSEKYRSVRLQIQEGLLRILASNPEQQEEAEDEIEINYQGNPMEIGFNVSYLMEAIAAVPTQTLQIYLTDPDSSCLIQPDGRSDCLNVIMPMRL